MLLNNSASRGGGGGGRRGCATWAPRSATRQGKEQHRDTERGSHTKRDKGEHSKQGRDGSNLCATQGVGVGGEGGGGSEL